MPDVKAAMPGVVRQVGYVVRDLDQAVATWLEMGVGPWYIVRDQPQQAVYRGKPCDVTTSIAFSNSGDLQLELIQQTDGTPSIYSEFLDSGREGFNQFAFWATDFDAALEAAKATGWPVVWSNGDNSPTRYAYLAPPAGPAAIIELMEYNPLTEGMFKLVHEAAANWDGTDPIRSLGG